MINLARTASSAGFDHEGPCPEGRVRTPAVRDSLVRSPVTELSKHIRWTPPPPNTRQRRHSTLSMLSPANYEQQPISPLGS